MTIPKFKNHCQQKHYRLSLGYKGERFIHIDHFIFHHVQNPNNYDVGERVTKTLVNIYYLELQNSVSKRAPFRAVHKTQRLLETKTF